MSVREQELLLDQLPTELSPCPAPHSSNPRPSYWQTHYQSPLEHHNADRRFPSEQVVDVVIIGSGITGTSIAADLIDRIIGRVESRDYSTDTRSAIKIVVLEAREFCSGATARNGGHLTALPRLQYKTLRDKYGTLDAKREVMLEDRACALVLNAVHRHRWDVDLVQGGNLHLFEDGAEAAEARAQIDAAQRDGVDVSMLHWFDRDQLRKSVGAEAHAALSMPGNNLYPLKYVSELFQQSLNKCQRSDKVTLDLYTHVPVINVERTSVKQGQRQRPSSDSTSPRWIVNTSRGDSIRARTVIHATNGYASSVVPSLANGPNRIVPTRGQVMAYQPRHDSSSDPRWTTAFASPGGREYFFQRPGDQGPIILGGARYSAGKPFEFGESDDGVVNSKVEKALAEYLPMQFPGYFAGPDREGREAQCWTGVMGYREGGVPMVGALYDSDRQLLEGQFISAGYSGHGMARASACAEVVADMALAELEGEMYQVPSWFPRHFVSGPGPERKLRPEIPDSRGKDELTRWWCSIS